MLDALLDELAESDDVDDEQSGDAPAPGMLITLPSSRPQSARHPIADALRSGQRATELDLSGADLGDVDLSELDLSGADLSGANLARAKLVGTNLAEANLEGAILFGACLDDADLSGAMLAGANLESAEGARTGFGGANLTGAKLAEARFDGCTLAEANLEGADLRGASFVRARAVRALFSACDATAAVFAEAHLQEIVVDEATFDHANMRGATLTGVRGYASASWIGTDTRDIPPLGIFMWRRFVTDQNYLAEFRTRGQAAEWIYRVWWLTSDCGRSMFRWAVCLSAIVVLFGLAYASVSIDYGNYETWLSPFYYSVVTLTSLGYGDVLPASPAAQALAMAEVLAGYLMLGGLLSILSNKMARRGD